MHWNIPCVIDVGKMTLIGLDVNVIQIFWYEIGLKLVIIGLLNIFE